MSRLHAKALDRQFFHGKYLAAWGLLLAATPLMGLLGCAQTRQGLTRVWGWNSQEVQFDEDSSTTAAGRVRYLESLVERSSELDDAERARLARSMSTELQDGQPKIVKMAILKALGRIESAAGVGGLQTALQDPDGDVRVEACRSLAKINSADAMGLLAGAVQNDQDPDVKLAAVKGLARYRDPRAVQALGVALDDRDPAVQYVAMQSLEKVTGKDLGPDVRQWKEVAQNPAAIFAERPTDAVRQ